MASKINTCLKQKMDMYKYKDTFKTETVSVKWWIVRLKSGIELSRRISLFYTQSRTWKSENKLYLYNQVHSRSKLFTLCLPRYLFYAVNIKLFNIMLFTHSPLPWICKSAWPTWSGPPTQWKWNYKRICSILLQWTGNILIHLEKKLKTTDQSECCVNRYPWPGEMAREKKVHFFLFFFFFFSFFVK